MTKAQMEKGLLWPAVGLLVVGTVVAAMQHGAAGHLAGVVLRLAAVVLLAAFALQRRTITAWIVVAMVAGIELGLDAPKLALETRFLSDIFLRLIKTIVGPLILGTLVSGMAGHGDLKGVGRMAWKSLVYFEVVTTLALVIGLVAINVTKAGVGMSLPQAQGSEARPGASISVARAPAMIKWTDFVVHVFPENLPKSLMEGQILQVSVFAVLFGIALALLGERGSPMVRWFELLAEVMFKFTNIVMYFAPVAVGAALAYTVALNGVGVLVNLGKLVLTYYGALGVLAGVGLARRRPWCVTVSAAWAVSATYAAAVASFAYSDPSFSKEGTVTGAIAAFLGSAAIGSLVVWAARVATRTPTSPTA